MTESFKIAIVGAGPGGLSAAARAAEQGVSHILLEASGHIAQTIRRFQKGKLVMAEPVRLPLRTSMGFAAATREEVLAGWQADITRHGVNLRTGAAVTGITGQAGAFRLALSSGEMVAAEQIVLALGLQGNIRKLGVPGEDAPNVQYQLDDPDEYRDETILVIGGGDAGVENALALAERNRVTLIIRQDEFTSCRESNLNRLKEAVRLGKIDTRTSTTSIAVESHPEDSFGLSLVAQSPHGVEHLKCHRIIARLGAIPPRSLLESFGIQFSSSEASAVPQLSERYESSVPGLYVIGALTGFPLIKQALNQGFEVIEYIQGSSIKPADDGLLAEKFGKVPDFSSVRESIERLRLSQPLLASLTLTQLHEFMLDSEVLTPRSGEIIFTHNDFSNSFYSILQGSVKAHVLKQDGRSASYTLTCGNFFGEISLLSGRRCSGTIVAGDDCILIKTPRRSMLRLLDSAPSVQRILDEVSLKRIIRNYYGASLPDSQIDLQVKNAKVRHYAVGEEVFRQGDVADALYLIRRGSVTVSQMSGGREIVLAYVSAGNYVGEMALAAKTTRVATVRAAAPTEMVVLDAVHFNALLDENPDVRSEVSARFLERLRANETAVLRDSSELINFLMEQGVGEATDILLIDYTKCIRCNNCEKACADTHDGTSRLNIDAGHTYQHLHVPASCRHCEHPRCMKDCPPDAIHRSPNGEVFISDSCIGCGQCQSNCPYGVIQMESAVEHHRAGLLQLITGWGLGRTARKQEIEPGKSRAVKCDMCRDIIGGPACVRACPTNAAFRISPERFISMAGT